MQLLHKKQQKSICLLPIIVVAKHVTDWLVVHIYVSSMSPQRSDYITMLFLASIALPTVLISVVLPQGIVIAPSYYIQAWHRIVLSLRVSLLAVTYCYHAAFACVHDVIRYTLRCKATKQLMVLAKSPIAEDAAICFCKVKITSNRFSISFI